MSKMEYLKDMPIAVLGGGAVGKTCAADMKLAGREVRLYDMMPFAETTLANVEKTGILLDGVQRNLYCFERSGRAFFDMVTSDIGKAVKSAGLIVVAAPAMAHEPFFRALIPHLEDGQVIHIFTDNFATLLLRKLMREMGCAKKVVIGGCALWDQDRKYQRLCLPACRREVSCDHAAWGLSSDVGHR